MTESNAKAKAVKPPVVPAKITATSTTDASPAPLDSLTAAPLKIRTSKTIKLKGQPEESSSTEELIEIHKFATQPAVASVSIPLKMTMDYQSLGIEIGVSLPCYAEELDAGIEKAYEIAFARITAKIPEIQKTLLEVTGRTAK